MHPRGVRRVFCLETRWQRDIDAVVALSVVPSVVVVVALTASYILARRATQIDPIEALRAE